MLKGFSIVVSIRNFFLYKMDNISIQKERKEYP